MSLNARLQERSQGTCELCNANPATNEYVISPKTEEIAENQVALCGECMQRINQPGEADYWRCLEGSIWNTEPAVQALSYRLLHFYRDTGWTADVTNSVELDENVVQWAMSAYEEADVHKDAFGSVLEMAIPWC